MERALPANEDRATLGIVMMLIAWFLFSCVDAGAKWLGALGLPAFQLAFMRYAGHFAIALAQLPASGLSLRQTLRTDHRWAVISRASVLVCATLFNFFALGFLPLSVASAIMFSSPIIVCLLSFLVLAERVGYWRWSAIILGFCGILIIIRPFGVAFHWTMLLCVFNAAALAYYALQTRRLAGKVSTETMQLWLGLLGTVALGPFALMVWINPDTLLGWSILCALGIGGWAGHQLLTNAHRFGTAATLMPYTYSFILYMTLWGYLVFDRLPDLAVILGACVIVMSGLIIWKRENR